MMKKNYMFTVVLCVLSLFTSCNDDKDDSSSVYVGDSLKLTLSGTTLSGKAVATDNTTITLNNVIPGEAELTLPITYTADGFIGKVKNEYREVEVDATVRDGVAEVKVNLTEINPLGGNTFATNAQSLRLDFATPKEKITFMGTDYDAKMLPVLVESQVSPMLSQLLKGIRFGADGVIVVEFIKEGGTHLTLGGYAFYNVVDDKIFVSLNMPAILSKSNINPLESIVSMLGGVGIPFDLSIKGNDASFTLTRETLLPVVKLLPLLITLDLIPENYVTIVTEISTIIQESTKFDIHLDLVKK